MTAAKAKTKMIEVATSSNELCMFGKNRTAVKFVLMGLFNSRSVVLVQRGMRTVVELTPKIRFTPVHNTVSENDRKTDLFNKILTKAGQKKNPPAMHEPT